MNDSVTCIAKNGLVSPYKDFWADFISEINFNLFMVPLQKWGKGTLSGSMLCAVSSLSSFYVFLVAFICNLLPQLCEHAGLWVTDG